MRSTQGNFEDEGLKRMDLLEDEALAVQSFDITEKVMRRIGETDRRRLRTGASAIRLKPRYAAPAAAAVLVLGLSVTGYAASQYLEFRNKAGQVVMDTALSEAPSADSLAYAQLWHGYYAQAKERLRPGEYAAYYVNDERINPPGASDPVQFVYREQRFADYSVWQEEAARTGAPELKNLVRLPEGYRFEYGYVAPSYALTSGLVGREEYGELVRELKGQSMKASGDRVFLRKLEWKTADLAVARYSKGDHFINLSVENVGTGSKLTIMQEEQDRAEKVTIHGQEAFYIHRTGTEWQDNARVNWLGWKDEENGWFYQLYDDPESSLTREELVRLAEELIAGE